MALDRVEVRDLLLRCIIGINPEERTHPQDVLINLTMFADLRPAGNSDDIGDAVNYKTASKRLTEFAVERVQVRVEKPGALRFARSVGVEIERTRADFDLLPLPARP